MLTTHMLRRHLYANVHPISDRSTAPVKLIYSMPCELCKDKLKAATERGLQKAYKAHFEMWHTTKEEREKLAKSIESLEKKVDTLAKLASIITTNSTIKDSINNNNDNNLKKVNA